MLKRSIVTTTILITSLSFSVEASPPAENNQVIAKKAANHFSMPVHNTAAPDNGAAELYLSVAPPAATAPANYVKCTRITIDSILYKCGLYFTRWVLDDDRLLAEAVCSKKVSLTVRNTGAKINAVQKQWCQHAHDGDGFPNWKLTEIATLNCFSDTLYKTHFPSRK